MDGFLILYTFLNINPLLFTWNNHGRVPPETRPVLRVNYVHPTADKPQSKLWFMDKCWWAILPDSTGPTFWRRTDKGWKSYPEVTANLKGLPGRADVWAEKKRVTAVGVADSSLSVFRLIKKSGSLPGNWGSENLATLYPPDPSPVETATIARDGKGIWWVAATAGLKVCVWYSNSDGKDWASPLILAEGIHEDDICVITPLPGGIGVIWSDQVRDAVLVREHRDGNAAGTWENEVVVDSGDKTADDHLNTSFAPDGTLWLTSKNSVDMAGQLQFVLRIRLADGKWINRPYLFLESRMKRPSRPIVIAAEDNSAVLVGHGDNDRSVPYPHNSNITFAKVDTSIAAVTDSFWIVISPDSVLRNVVHNVTGPRKPFPKDGPWIILAGDAAGRVYEADLRKRIQ